MTTAHCRRALIATMVAIAALGAGCASTRLDAQWSDPQSAGATLRGTRLLVACEARDLTLRQLCEQRLADEVSAGGGQAMSASAVPALAAMAAPTAEAYVDAARAREAAGVLVVQIAAADVQQGSPVSLGIGGFSIGGSGGLGVGLSVPVGGSGLQVGYQASGRLVQVAGNRLMWTGRATSPASTDVPGQLDELTRALFEGVRKAGFL